MWSKFFSRKVEENDKTIKEKEAREKEEEEVVEIRLTEPVTNEADRGVLIGRLDQMLAKLEEEEKLGETKD